MNNMITANFGNLLTKVASTLDIPNNVYEDAKRKYEEIGSWLGSEDSDLARYKPEIFVQGSFRLGTVIHPINQNDQYDIDLVCHLDILKENVTQEELKKIVGDRIKQRKDLKEILKPSRRCWTLNYPNNESGLSFHMDILPAIPNIDRPPTGILLTDTELRLWQFSNPKAYGEWFYGRMKQIYMEKKAALAKDYEVDVEEVPDWHVKTPLQIAIQILKRHRDIHFQSNADNRPVSIIITTLAARAYEGQADIYDSLVSIISNIEENYGKPDFIENVGGKWWVKNPVDDGENFADKWNEYPERHEAFNEWLFKVSEDIKAAASEKTLSDSINSLRPVLGSYPMDKIAAELDIDNSTGRKLQAADITTVPELESSNHCQRAPWAEKITHEANLSVTVHTSQYGNLLWKYVGRPQGKRLWLRIQLTTNFPMPFQVKWQVVNTGNEARNHGQLRGHFYDGEEGSQSVTWERTAFRGTHWVEGFVIRNNVCVAKTGKTYIRVR